MSRYLDRMLLVDESVVYVGGLHWIVYHFGMTTTIAGALVGHYGRGLVSYIPHPVFAALAAKMLPYLSMVIIAVGALHLFFGFIRQISTELIITNKRVIAKHGFIATETNEVMINKVATANIEQTMVGRILGYGTLIVQGSGGGIAPIDHVADPYRFHSYLLRTIEFAQQKQGAKPSSPGSAPDTDMEWLTPPRGK